MKIKHSFQSAEPASSDPAVVGSEQWNDEHAVTGSRFIFGDVLYPIYQTVDTDGSHYQDDGVHLTKTAVGQYTVVAPNLLGVIVQTMPGFVCEPSPVYYDSLPITFRRSSDNAIADPDYASIMGFGDGIQHS